MLIAIHDELDFCLVRIHTESGFLQNNGHFLMGFPVCSLERVWKRSVISSTHLNFLPKLQQVSYTIVNEN